MRSYMNVFFKNFRSDKTLLYGFLTTVGLTFITAFLTLIFYKNLPPLIPLYNQMPWGDTRLGTKPELFIPIVVSLTIFLGNLIFSQVIYVKMPLVSRLLLITSLMISFLTFLFILRTILLVL